MDDYGRALEVKNRRADDLSQLFPKIGLKLPLYNFQKKGVLYLYAAKKCILGDNTGLGKTIQIIGLIQAIQNLEKNQNNRWILVVPPSTILQWMTEWEKFSTLEPLTLGIGNRRERISHYMMQGWQFYIMSYQILWRDWEEVADLGIKNWVFDDAHFFRHHNTKTAHIIKDYLIKGANRVILSTATPIMKDVRDLHSLLEGIGLRHVFGSQIGFENHYCQIRKTRHILKDGRAFWKKEVVGLRNKTELKAKLNPYYLMRTFEDVGEELPKLVVKTVRLRLHKDQIKIHEQLRKRMIKAWDSGQFRTVRNKGFHSMRQVCSGTQTMGFEKDVSSKLDAIEQFIADKLGRKDKVIIYSFYKQTVYTICERLKKMNRTDFEYITGDITDKHERERIKQRFLTEKDCRILVGTDAIKTGINLQSARYLIMVDLILNPQEIVQLIGRMRRLGSKEKHVVLYVLLCKGTIEEGIWNRLKWEAAISSVIFDKASDVFPKLTDVELMTLVRQAGEY